MVKKTRPSRKSEGLTQKQIIGLFLILIFIASTLAIAAIQAGI